MPNRIVNKDLVHSTPCDIQDILAQPQESPPWLDGVAEKMMVVEIYV
jgi:hypothetical protein